MRRRAKAGPAQALFAATATLGLLVAAAGPPSPPVPLDYLSVAPTQMVFVVLSVSGPRVSGTLYTNALTGALPSLRLRSATTRFAGAATGEALTIFLAGSHKPLQGSYNTATLSLEVPGSHGTVAVVHATRAPLIAYQRALANWRAATAKANTASATATSIAEAEAQRQQLLLDGLNQSVHTVDADVSGIEAPSGLGSDENLLRGDVALVQGDLQVVATDRSVFATDLRLGRSPCGDIVGAYGDALTAYRDEQSMMEDAKSGVGADIKGMRQLMTDAPGDWAAYAQAQDALPSYRPTSPVPALDLVLARGQAVIKAATLAVNADIDRANGYVERAYATVNAADKTNHCGPVKKAPAVRHVTEGWLTS